MFELRPYQLEAVRAVEDEWKSGHRKTLVVSPTASGKTIMMGQVIKDSISDGSKALILAHRGELLDQARDKLKSTYDIDSALEKAESTSLGSPFSVTVGSIQTLANPIRLHKFNRNYFKTILVDEAHHSLANSYQTILNYFDNANVPVLLPLQILRNHIT